jgi:alpha-L-rhamnosidase
MKSLFLLSLIFTASVSAQMTITNLRCEYLVNPIGIDTPHPRLSWMLDSPKKGERQTAYQILVATSEPKLARDQADLWDTGKVQSNQTTQIEYRGLPLSARQRAFWKVRSWDRDGKLSESKPASFEMGLKTWQAKWIGNGGKSGAPAPMLRKSFRAKSSITRARLYICGLGYYDCSLNGQKVGDHMLDPGYTNYDKRVLYVTYDVTRQIKDGENAIGVILGTGWYDVHTKAVWHFDQAPWRDRPKLLLQLVIDYADGSSDTIASDESWKTSTGAITFDSIYSGEHYDARLEKTGWDKPGFDDSAWKHAIVVNAPKGKLVAQQMPPIRATAQITPVKITQPKPGVYVFDMGQNFAGVPMLTAQAPAGTTVTMRCAERIDKDGMIDTHDVDVFVKQEDATQTFQEDRYTFKGAGVETWHPRFTYHGFQYVEVTGLPVGATLASPSCGQTLADARVAPTSLRALFMHTDLEPAGTFECSNPLLNKIVSAARWSYLSNLMSIPTDCPQREKNGWTGDAHLACEQGLFTFDGAPVYTKWINDVQDAMRDDGDLPGIVPTGGWGYTLGAAWDSAFFLIPAYLNEYAADERILTSHYPAMKKYVDFVTRKSTDHIVNAPLGDWVPFEAKTSTELTTTAYYFRDAQIVAHVAKTMGNAADAKKYGDLADTIKSAFNKKFFDPKTGNYAEGTQTAQACALFFHLVPENERQRVFENLVKQIEARKDHLDGGILGAKYVMQVLLDHDRVDLAYKIATQTDLPSWGHWIQQGATTLWENWDGSASRNHIMFGDVVAWMFKALAGIQPDPAHPGFEHFFLRPHVVGDLTHVRAEHRTMHGTILSEWTLKDGRVHLHIKVPVNTTATLTMPTLGPDRTLELESGEYEFDRALNR